MEYIIDSEATRTPGCSCDGLRDALAARDRYRGKALEAACWAKIVGKAPCAAEGCQARKGYCSAVIKEVDGL